MKLIKTVHEMQDWSTRTKRRGDRVGFVPTMGFLHQGHVSLLEIARPLCQGLVLSIFVNPTQFGPTEDLDAYPRDLENDLALAEKAGVDAVFLPTSDLMYPDHFQTEISLSALPGHLCGRFRPVHFAGVATVVTKLFNIVRPDMAVFGEKDYQQLQVIRQMVRDLNFPIEIVGGPIVREADGLAMSSRNAYLSPSQRASAVSLSRALETARDLLRKGSPSAAELVETITAFIHTHDQTDVEYVEICHPQTLEPVTVLSRPFLIALAVKVGTTRLIDNALFNAS